jgi:hypothetical protein
MTTIEATHEGKLRHLSDVLARCGLPETVHVDPMAFIDHLAQALHELCWDRARRMFNRAVKLADTATATKEPTTMDSDSTVMDRVGPEAMRQEIGRAIASLREHGWCQGTFADTEGRICLVSALASTGNRWPFPEAVTPTVRATILHVGAHLGADIPASHSEAWQFTLAQETLCEWNNQPGRTAAEVVDMLTQAQGALAA